MKLKEFNLEIALKDPSQVVRGDGKQVVYISEVKDYNPLYPLYVCFKNEDGSLFTRGFTKDGILNTHRPSDSLDNLFLKPKETIYFYNIYKSNLDGKIWIGTTYSSTTGAINKISLNVNSIYIKTESFTVEE